MVEKFLKRKGLCLSLCLALLALPSAVSAQDKPNFLVIVAQDLGWSDPGFFGE